LFSPIRKNNMAKAVLEGAIWDIYAQQTNQSLAKAIGGTKDKIEVGISIGIQDTLEKQIEVVDRYVKAGYKLIKVKIKPGLDIEMIRVLRDNFPNVATMPDAN